MNAISKKWSGWVLGLSLLGSGCGMTHTRLASGEEAWRMPEDARVEQLEANTPERDLDTILGQACKGFRLTAVEARWVLEQSQEVSYQEWEALPCEVRGRLRSDLEPERDIRFTVNVLGTVWLQEDGRSHYLACQETCDDLMVAASERGG